MTFTRHKFAAANTALLRKIEVSVFRDGTSQMLMNAARSALMFFKPDEPGSSSDHTPDFSSPEPMEVANFISDLIPSALEILDEKFFRSPLFPVVILYDISELYGFGITSVDDAYIAQVNLTRTDKTTRKLCCVSGFRISWTTRLRGLDR